MKSIDELKAIVTAQLGDDEDRHEAMSILVGILNSSVTVWFSLMNHDADEIRDALQRDLERGYVEPWKDDPHGVCHLVEATALDALQRISRLGVTPQTGIEMCHQWLLYGAGMATMEGEALAVHVRKRSADAAKGADHLS